MRTKIVPANRGSYYAMEERISTENKTDPDDNQLVRIVGRGFVPYLIWEYEHRPVLRALMSLRNDEVTPTKEDQNRTYFDHMLTIFDIPEGLPYAPTPEEKKSIFKPIHALNERKEFEALPDDLKKTYGQRFEKYMIWLDEGKGYDSIVRVRAFIMMLDQEGGKIDFHRQDDNTRWNKTGTVYDYIKGRWPDQSQMKLYDQFKEIMARPDHYKKTYSKDFAYACSMVLINKNP